MDFAFVAHICFIVLIVCNSLLQMYSLLRLLPSFLVEAKSLSFVSLLCSAVYIWDF